MNDSSTATSMLRTAWRLFLRSRKPSSCSRGHKISRSNLRSHKISSNKNEVMAACPPHNHTNGLKELDLSKDVLPMQRSLGLLWDLKNYAFTFNVVDMFKPFTRRWVLANIKSVYDPLEFAFPVTLQRKIILRKHTTETEIPYCRRNWKIPGAWGRLP